MVDRQETDAVREVRFEGWGLLAVVSVLVIAGGISFYGGRLYERGLGPSPAVVSNSDLDPLGQIVHQGRELPPADVEEAADHFDGPANAGTPAEPRREIPQQKAADATEGRPDPEATRVDDGAFFVQVFAGRDRRAAELLIEKLRSDSFAVKLFSQSEGQGSLYKVRVGGYKTRDAARVAAGELQKKGYNGAWVTSGG